MRTIMQIQIESFKHQASENKQTKHGEKWFVDEIFLDVHAWFRPKASDKKSS